MTVIFHPEFPKDIQKFQIDYGQISDGLALRFRNDIDSAVKAIKHSPGGSGHFLSIGSNIVPELRRRNLTVISVFYSLRCC